MGIFAYRILFLFITAFSLCTVAGIVIAGENASKEIPESKDVHPNVGVYALWGGNLHRMVPSSESAVRVTPYGVVVRRSLALNELYFEGRKTKEMEIISKSKLLRCIPPTAVAKGSYKLSTIGNTHSLINIQSFLIKHHAPKSLAAKCAPNIMRFLKNPAGKRFLLVTAAVSAGIVLYELLADEEQDDPPPNTLIVLDYTKVKLPRGQKKQEESIVDDEDQFKSGPLNQPIKPPR